jgi:NAD dependent epimerase/dehydratase family
MSRSLINSRRSTSGQCQPGLSRRHGQPASETSVLASIFSRQTFIILSVGMIIGYVVLPVLLIEMDMNTPPESLPRIKYPSQFDLVNKDVEHSFSHDISNTEVFDRNLDLSIMNVEDETISKIQKRLVEDMALLSTQSIPTSSSPIPMKTAKLPDHLRKKILVTGGAGFVGSHLVDKLMMEGHEVIVVDNFFTGQKKNIAHWLQHPQFRYVMWIWYTGRESNSNIKSCF